MKSYKVKSGDTLGSIALKQLGATGRWREIAELNMLVNPNVLTIGQVLKLPIVGEPENSTRAADVVIIEEDNIYFQYMNDPTKRFLGKKHKKGIFRMGNQRTETFIADNQERLKQLKISESEKNALLAVSENEGNLDAINTWDNSFMSFGMFQWTLGPKNDKGELPALVKLLKQKFPDAYEKYCGQFDLSVTADTNSVTGYLKFKNRSINTTEKKQFFRSNIVAYRFANAGTDPRVNAVQVLHAINRFDRFYFNKSERLNGFSLHNLLSSEYAAALFLDNHVNRPGYLVKCVAKGIQQAGLTPKALFEGGDDEEIKVINQYLKVRETFGRSPMTHAKIRAAHTKKYLDKGKISAKKGSFISNRKLRN